MKEGNDGFVRADQIDLKSIDEQLERHLNRALTMEKSKKREEEADANVPAATTNIINAAAAAAATMSLRTPKKQRQDWEIDPSKLIIKTVIARGTFATVHRGVYDGQDVAGLVFLPSPFCVLSSPISGLQPNFPFFKFRFSKFSFL